LENFGAQSEIRRRSLRQLKAKATRAPSIADLIAFKYERERFSGAFHFPIDGKTFSNSTFA